MTTVLYGDFEWDAEKAAANLKKHGVSFEEAATVFQDPLAVDYEDITHPSRILILGTSAKNRLLIVVSVERISMDGAVRIRLISARLPTKHERRRYEEHDNE